MAERLTEDNLTQCYLRAAQPISLQPYLSHLVHQLNNPLAIIYGESFKLREKAKSSGLSADELVRVAESMERLSLRLISHIQDLRLALRSEEDELEEVFSVEALFDLALKYVALEIENAKVDLKRAPAASLTMIRGRRMQLARVVFILLQNGVEALTSVVGPRQLTLYTEQGDEDVTIHVSDNGPGIALDLQPRIFQPFVTNKEKHSGLGLFAAKFWLEQNGGALSFSTAAPQTTFSARLPRFKK